MVQQQHFQVDEMNRATSAESSAVQMVVVEVQLRQTATRFEKSCQVESLDVVSVQRDLAHAEQAPEEAIIDDGKHRIVGKVQSVDLVEAMEQASVDRSQTVFAQVQILEAREVGEQAGVVKGLDPITLDSQQAGHALKPTCVDALQHVSAQIEVFQISKQA